MQTQDQEYYINSDLDEEEEEPSEQDLKSEDNISIHQDQNPSGRNPYGLDIIAEEE